MTTLPTLLALKLQDMKTGERSRVEFGTLDQCEQWLRARPAYVEVLGPDLGDASGGTGHIPTELDQRLRAATRAFDASEQALLDAERAAAEVRAAAAATAAQAEIRAAQSAHQEQMAALGPDESMALRWTPAEGVTHADPHDTRPIPEVASTALREWVEERASWVRGRGQVIAEAAATVWPGALPAGEDERVQPGGQFVPVSA